MELKDDEFQTLRLKVDQISSELEKQHAIRAVNKKWMVIVGSLILAALGFTSFIQVPREAANAARKAIGPEVIAEVEGNRQKLNDYKNEAEDILSYMKNFDQLAQKDGYAWVGGILFQWGTAKRNHDGSLSYDFPEPFPNECFSVVPNVKRPKGKATIDIASWTKDKFIIDRNSDIDGYFDINYIAVGH